MVTRAEVNEAKEKQGARSDCLHATTPRFLVGRFLSPYRDLLTKEPFHRQSFILGSSCDALPKMAAVCTTLHASNESHTYTYICVDHLF